MFPENFGLSVFVGSEEITGKVAGDLTITREESAAALCDVTFIPDSGTYDFSRWHGKTVTVTAFDASNTWTLYTGRVDIPDADIINTRITLRCTDSRSERNNALPASTVSDIGFFSEAVFGEPEDQNDEIESRLETIPYGWDYSPDGIGRLTAWEPKATPDFLLDDTDIYRRNPSVEVLSRGRVTNKSVIDISFQYQRLRQRTINYTFDSQLGPCYYSSWGLPPTATQLQQAIEAAGWPHTGFDYTGLDSAGTYTCQDGDKIHWSPVATQSDVTTVVDENGNPILDANGNQQYTASISSQTDSTNVYAQTASWTASNRWSQNIEEKITVTLTAPQSIAQYGEVETSASYGEQSEFDTEEWEDYESYQVAPPDFLTSANGDKYKDETSEGLSRFNAMALCAINRAKTKIIKEHRDNRVMFETSFWPDVDLSHTVQTGGVNVRAKGKVRRIVHRFDVTNRDSVTEVELALSQSIGNASDTPVAVPARPSVDDAANTVDTSIALGTHTIPENGTQDDGWAGYIFQRIGTSSQGFPFKRPVSMIVDTPGIDNDRESREVEGASSYTIAIRDDLLEVDL